MHVLSNLAPKTYILTLCLFATLSLSAQTILIQPYLQDAEPTSIIIKWETDVNTQSTIQYGVTSSLGQTANGTVITTLGGKILHSVQLTNLSPATRYFYKAITGNWQSSIFDFVTPPNRNSEASFNIVLMSDMQKDGSNPSIFQNLINTSLLPYVDAHYGSPLSEHLQMAVLPGDVVDAGNTYLQWKNDFFNPGEVLWRSVPCYPAIGNHEANSQNYFDYYTLPANGTPGYLEHWYYKDYSNVRVLSINSNSPYRIQAQLNWVDSILNLSCADTLIDFVFAEMHHPYKSELWLPGEASYTGDVVERLEAFSENCGKPTVHFFGHTHAYSRGESRDHNHLWVNVATSGGNIDYWGEYANVDYDEYVISQDEYGFVMVEVTAGPNPKFVLKRLSFGDEYNPGGSTEADMVTIRKNNAPPATPLPLYPLPSDTVSAYCLTLKADGFSDPDGDEMGAAQWQISTDSINFTNPVYETWKQYANWFNEVNLQANDDLTDQLVNNLQGDSTLYWRVRYRDKSLAWSAWSPPTRLVTDPLTDLTSNLIVNPGAENGIANWTTTTGVLESLNPLECAGIDPNSGSKYFAVGALCVEYPFASAYQDINISTHAALIDDGEVLVNYGAYMADYANTDEPSFALMFLNSGGQVISGTDTTRYRQSEWMLKQKTVLVPVGTRTIRYIIMGTRFAGTDNDSYLDDIFCKLQTGLLNCSSYAPPGPAHGRVYVDEHGPGTPDGKSWLTAYRDLGSALLQSNADTSIHEIWIADGTYPVSNGSYRDTAFVLTRSVRIYGGFSGHETSLSQRNTNLNAVMLTGEMGDTSQLHDNAYHVIQIFNTIDTTWLDGLHIIKGYADGPTDQSGGGMYIAVSNRKPVVLKDCLFEDNYAITGSSIFNASEVILDQCTLTNTVIEGVTGCSVLNSGSRSKMTLKNSTATQYCSNCPEVIRNQDSANLQVEESVMIEKQ